MIRLAIADDQRLFRECLAAVAASEGMDIVGLAQSRSKLLRMVLEQEPDLAVMKSTIGGISIPEFITEIQDQRVSTRVLVVTGFTDVQLVKVLLQVGVDGCVYKDDTLEEMLMAMQCVAGGKSFVSSQLTASLVTDGNHNSRLSLTFRQLEVLHLIASGDTNHRIARKLGISVRTVEHHRNGIREKLGVQTAAEMIRVATERGLTG